MGVIDIGHSLSIQSGDEFRVRDSLAEYQAVENGDSQHPSLLVEGVLLELTHLRSLVSVQDTEYNLTDLYLTDPLKPHMPKLSCHFDNGASECPGTLFFLPLMEEWLLEHRVHGLFLIRSSSMQFHAYKRVGYACSEPLPQGHLVESWIPRIRMLIRIY